MSNLSWLDPTPHATAVYASCSALLPPHATLASRRPATAVPGPDLHRLIAPALAGAFGAVGMRVASHPPHSPVRAAFRIRFPPRVSTANNVRRMQASAWSTRTRYCARCVWCWSAVPLGLCPWLHRLRSGPLRRGLLRNDMLHFVRRLHSYYGRARLLVPVHHRLRLLVFPMRTVPRTQR